MLYTSYELAYAAISPARIAAGLGARFWRSPFNPAAQSWVGRSAAAALEVCEHAMRRYPKPEWGIDATTINGVEVPLTIETATSKAFCTLLHFKRDAKALAKIRGNDTPDPKVLIVAPLLRAPVWLPEQA